MTINSRLLPTNSYIYLIADIFWNMGRTIPHAILTILLLQKGYSLQNIGIIQIIYMIVIIFAEFPSGILADRISRKYLYIGSIILILCSYFLIYSFFDNIFILMIAWGVYGLSVSVKSGTIENDVVLEIRNNKKALHKLTTVEMVFSYLSSIVGALVGAYFYPIIDIKIYLISIFFFSISIMISLFFKSPVKKYVNKQKQKHIKINILDYIKMFCHPKYFLIIGSFFTISIFSQPFYQYWQAFYHFKQIPIHFFGVVYVIFQICGILSSLLYSKVKDNYAIIMGIESMIIAIVIILFFTKNPYVIFVGFPILLIPFNLFSQFITIYMRQIAPEEKISAFTSFLGFISNIASIIILGMIIICLRNLSINQVYLMFFILFSILSSLLIRKILNENL